MVSIQKIDRIGHTFPVFFFCEDSLTGRIALADLVIQTRPLFSDVARQIFAAAADLIQLLYEIDRIFYRRGTCVRTEIA